MDDEYPMHLALVYKCAIPDGLQEDHYRFIF